MGDKETGDFAFPRDGEDWKSRQDGMTLRDYFAAKALQGMLSNAKLATTGGRGKLDAEYNQDWHAEAAYQFADAMIKERLK